MTQISSKGITFRIDCGSLNVDLLKNRCKNCYIKAYPLIKKKKKISDIKICKNCSNYYNGHWLKPKNLEFYDYLSEIINASIDNFIEKTDNIVLNFEFNTTFDLLWSNKSFLLTIKAEKFFPEFNEKLSTTIVLPVKVNFTYCDNCLMVKRGVHKVVINVIRKKEFSNIELDYLFDLIENEINKIKDNELNAYLSNYEIGKHRIKLFLGSIKLAKNISQLISNKWGGIIKDYNIASKKSLDKGKKNEKYIININLPEFSSGDVILINDVPYFIKSIKKDIVHLVNLKTKTTTNLSMKKGFEYSLIKSQENLDKFIFISSYDDLIQIMDEKTFQLYEILKSDEFLNINTNMKLLGFIYNNQVYIIPKYD